MTEEVKDLLGVRIPPQLLSAFPPPISTSLLGMTPNQTCPPLLSKMKGCGPASQAAEVSEGGSGEDNESS